MPSFKSCINDLFNEEVRRLMATRKQVAVDALWNTLLEAKLTPDDIDKFVCEELKRVCAIRYEVVQNSNRLEGFGWSSMKVHEHMERVLKAKLKAVSHVLRTGHAEVEVNERFSSTQQTVKARDALVKELLELEGGVDGLHLSDEVDNDIDDEVDVDWFGADGNVDEIEVAIQDAIEREQPKGPVLPAAPLKGSAVRDYAALNKAWAEDRREYDEYVNPTPNVTNFFGELEEQFEARKELAPDGPVDEAVRKAATQGQLAHEGQQDVVLLNRQEAGRFSRDGAAVAAVAATSDTDMM